VGLGGRLDATNVVAAPVVCGITSLGFDHMELLGHTLPVRSPPLNKGKTRAIDHTDAKARRVVGSTSKECS
jgi:hypothetical protein